MTYQTLITEQSDHILFVKFNRPEKLNALNKALLSDLGDLIQNVQSDPSVRVVILSGEGRAFVAGADIAEFANFGASEGYELSANGHKTVFNAIEQSIKPFIAAINGYALGGGLEIALSCHLRIASDKASFALPELSLGLIPGYGGTQRLVQIVGKGRALDVILRGRSVGSSEALNIGLVSAVVPSELLMEEAFKLGQEVAFRSPQAVTAAIVSVNASGSPDGFEVEINQFASLFGTDDFREGTAAFLAKRKPSFTNR